ncbi:MAG: AI-2E family transporter [Chitinophagaceae bacterium]|nr:AI-2E family transporter [Chitinophagaceae bacterium]
MKNAFPFYAKLAFHLVSLFILGYLIHVGSSIIMPFCFAIVLAMLLLPVVNWLIKRGIPSVPAMLLAVFLAILFVGGIIYFLSNQVGGFMSDLPTIKEKLNHHITTLQGWIQANLNIDTKQQKAAVESAKQNIQQSGTGGMGSALMGIASGLVMVVLLPIYTFLLLYYRKLIHKFLLDVFPDQHRSRVEGVLTESKTIIQGYMVGLLLEMAIVTVLNVTGFLVIGIQYAIFLAVLAAVLNLIPYVGMLIASVICMAVTLTTSDSMADVIWVGVILVVVQFIDNNFIMPYVVSSKVRINALVSIIGVLVGGALAGISGMFLSIPGMAILKAVFERVDGLEPWGNLLGDDRPVKKGRRKKK